MRCSHSHEREPVHGVLHISWRNLQHLGIVVQSTDEQLASICFVAFQGLLSLACTFKFLLNIKEAVNWPATMMDKPSLSFDGRILAVRSMHSCATAAVHCYSPQRARTCLIRMCTPQSTAQL